MTAGSWNQQVIDAIEDFITEWPLKLSIFSSAFQLQYNAIMRALS